MSEVASLHIPDAVRADHGVADAIQGACGVPREETIRQIRHLFIAELGSPTDIPRGEFV